MGKVLDRLSGQTLRYWGFLAVAFALSFLFKVVAARALGPELYGTFGIALVLATFLAFVSELGYPYALTKFIAEHRARDDPRAVAETLTGCLSLVVVSGAIVGVALYLGADVVATTLYGDPSIVGALRLFALAIPLYTLFDSMFYALRGFQRQDHEGTVRALAAATQLAVALYVLSRGGGLEGVIAAVVASYGASALVGAVLIHRTSPGLRPVLPTRAAMERLSLFALPMGVSNVLATMSELVDTAIIVRIRGLAEVGAYQACFPFTVSLTNLVIIITPLIMPLASGLSSARDRTRLARLFAVLVRFPWFAFLPLMVLVAGIAEPLVTLLYAQRYSAFLPEMARLSAVLALAVLFQMLGLMFFQMAGGLGRSREVLGINLAYLVVLASLDLILVPPLGATGAALARLAAAVIAVTLYLRLLGGEVGWPSMEGIPTTAILALVTLAAMRAVPLADPASAVIVRALVGAALYLPAFLYLCVTEADRTIVREFVQGLSKGGSDTATVADE